MNAGPILVRELRQQARQTSTYWLRVLGGGLVLAAATWALFSVYVQTANGIRMGGRVADGRGLFWGLNKLLAVLLWLVAPILTADCLAREKREGTLGLLFLTPLRGVDVVLGKAASNSFRALMVLGAAYPVLMLPVLIGGISWLDGLRMFLLQLAILGLALASGVTASALTRDWLRARLLALGFTAAASLIFLTVYIGSWTLWRSYAAAAAAARLVAAGKPALARNPESLWDVFANAFNVWAGNQLFQFRSLEGLLRGGGIPSNAISVFLSLGVLAVCWGLVALSVRFAAAGLVRTARRDAAPPPPNRVARELTRDRFAVRWQARQGRRVLDRNPVAWLHRPRWSGRIGRWIWCGWAGLEISLIVSVLSERMDRWGDAATILVLFPIPILVAIAFSAAASYRSERETGALELLLVTPLSPSSILWGRLQSLAETFAPALVMMTLSRWVVGLEIFPKGGSLSLTGLRDDFISQGFTLCLGPAGIAVLALAYGLRTQNVLAATLKAVFAWLGAPYLVSGSLLLGIAAFNWLSRPGSVSPGVFEEVDRVRISLLTSHPEQAWISLAGGLLRLGLVYHAWRSAKVTLAQRLYLRSPQAKKESPQ